MGFARALTYAHMNHYHRWMGDWPKAYRTSGYEALVRRECEMAPEDLWIRSAYSTDNLLADPVRWVNDQLARYTASAAE